MDPHYRDMPFCDLAVTHKSGRIGRRNGKHGIPAKKPLGQSGLIQRYVQRMPDFR
jgi:hypothetical protein